ncbi:MAG: DUF924 domain-containing protein [Rhodanobacter sp.]|jgi:uncharacterized protein (DUF924 family)|nr:DUF924 domain-containing protein [Rhodanobacter sp.]MBN8946829.1 DUF924 domain-containing protein [Rhodanobacter sp.]OJW43792.1 MAG: hypothetical protein BGO50_18230 [Rhodanobacter sp. 67-28]
MAVQPRDVLDFWFDPAHAAHWFAKDAAFDEQIRRRFAVAADDAAQGRLDAWASNPADWLALLILLDQFPRNLHRGDAQAWAADVKAQRIALSGLAGGFDQALPPLQRVFAYLPLEHAEDMGLQQRAVTLFEALHAQAPVAGRARFAEFLDYARRHREVIARFGRFPHRNAVLGRDSTAAEREYLAQPGAGF